MSPFSAWIIEVENFLGYELTGSEYYVYYQAYCEALEEM